MNQRIDNIVVYRAREIITMEPSLPTATAVAVHQGRILSVGSFDDIRPWLQGRSYTINDDFYDSVIVPGFIDTHVHPLPGALICNAAFLTPFSWKLPWQNVAALTTPDAYRTALKKFIDQHTSSPDALLTWGYHEAWHGPLSKQELDLLSPKIPLVVWHFSTHEIYVNSSALQHMQLPTAIPAGINPAHIDREQGHFFETGAFFAANSLKNLFHNTSLIEHGMTRFLSAVHAGGITTIADMATGILTDLRQEAALLTTLLTKSPIPIRLLMTPDAKQLSSRFPNKSDIIKEIESVVALHHHEQVFFGKQVKLFADGAFFSQRMRMEYPGYIDGHHGEWVMDPQEFQELAQLFWRAGYTIHVHTNGNEGLEMVLTTLAMLHNDHPRFDHRFTVEHCGCATDDQLKRLHTLGALVSAQVYYVYTLAERYAIEALGTDRAAYISPIGSLAQHGIPFSIHSDFPLAPLQPLFLAHIAHTRTTSNGTIIGPRERITRYQALRAITSDAAYILRLEHEIGSIRAGKFADFTILDHNPLDAYHELKDITVHGTIMRGIAYPST